MLDFPRWKVWATIVTIVVCIALSIPSFLPKATLAQLPGWLPRINLGLDLAGGSYLLFEADTKSVAAARLESMQESIRTDLRRNPAIKISQLKVEGGKVSFVVDDATKVDAVRERLLPLMGSGVGMTGQREWDLAVVDSNRVELTPTQAGIDQTINQAMDDAREIVGKRINALGTLEPTIIRQGSNRILVQVPGLDNPQQVKDLVGKTAKLEFKLVDEETSRNPIMLAQNTPPPGTRIMPLAEGGAIAVYSPVSLSGDQLIDARLDFDPQTNAPGVSIAFDGAGTKRFARLSTENTNKRFAIIVDGIVISAPVFNEPILGGQARISGGGFTTDSAGQLAIALRSGKLPVDLKVVEERTVSAELGRDSIEKGVLAGIIGTLALMAFMLITYLRFGVYTTLALVVNAFMILGIMAMFTATLTLPGIAGFVLTIGAAVDANVLINERIREEQRTRNRNALDSVKFGYLEASRAIFDANITNVISAVIMFGFGSGPIRGFAVVLAIGIVTSVFTGVTFTRLLVADWLKRNRPKTINI